MNQLEERVKELEAEILEVARACGIYYEADGHNDEPGPIDAIVEEIKRLRDLQYDKIEHELLVEENSRLQDSIMEHREMEVRLETATELLNGLEYSLDGRCPYCGWLRPLHIRNCQLAEFISAKRSEVVE